MESQAGPQASWLVNQNSHSTLRARKGDGRDESSSRRTTVCSRNGAHRCSSSKRLLGGTLQSWLLDICNAGALGARNAFLPVIWTLQSPLNSSAVPDMQGCGMHPCMSGKVSNNGARHDTHRLSGCATLSFPSIRRSSQTSRVRLQTRLHLGAAGATLTGCRGAQCSPSSRIPPPRPGGCRPPAARA